MGIEANPWEIQATFFNFGHKKDTDLPGLNKKANNFGRGINVSWCYKQLLRNLQISHQIIQHIGLYLYHIALRYNNKNGGVEI